MRTANKLFEYIQDRGQKNLSLKQTWFLRDLILRDIPEAQYEQHTSTWNWMHEGGVRSMSINPVTGCGRISEVR